MAVAILFALALYTFLPSDLFTVQRYVVAGIGIVLFVPLIIINPHHFTRETRISRIAEVTMALIIVAANQLTLVLLILELTRKTSDGGPLLLASLQVWVTNVIAFVLVYWCLDRGGPVARTSTPRAELR